MKSTINKARNKLGILKPKKKPSSFEYLKELERYHQTTIQLLKQEFKVADPLSFYYSHREIFTEEIYKFPTSNKSPVIIDCGSNYGTSIVYFKSLYPDSKITGIEADPEIFKLLEWNINLRSYEDTTLINKAITNSNKPVRFFQEGADSGRLFPIEDSNNYTDVSPVHLDSLITDPVDLLKMDIEGSEAEVICSSEQLRLVNHLFIEYHSFKDSPQTLGAMLEKISSSGFRYYIHTQLCSPRPLTEEKHYLGMDLQLNIFCKK